LCVFQVLQATEVQWQKTLANDQSLLAGYVQSLASIRQKMNADMQALGPLFGQLQTEMTQQIAQLNAAIQQAKQEESADLTMAALDTAAGLSVGWIPFVGGDAEKADFFEAKQALAAAAKEAAKIVVDQAKIKLIEEKQKLLAQLNSSIVSLESLNSQLTQQNTTLPQLLPGNRSRPCLCMQNSLHLSASSTWHMTPHQFPRSHCAPVRLSTTDIFLDEVDQADVQFELKLLSKTLEGYPGGDTLISTIEDFVALSQVLLLLNLIFQTMKTESGFCSFRSTSPRPTSMLLWPGSKSA